MKKKLLTIGEQIVMASRKNGTWAEVVRPVCRKNNWTLAEFRERYGIISRSFLRLLSSRLPDADHLEADIFSVAGDCRLPEDFLSGMLIRSGVLVRLVKDSLARKCVLV